MTKQISEKNKESKSVRKYKNFDTNNKTNKFCDKFCQKKFCLIFFCQTSKENNCLIFCFWRFQKKGFWVEKREGEMGLCNPFL